MLGRLLRELLGRNASAASVDPEALFRLGNELAAQARWSEAAEALAQAVEGAPDNPGYRIALGRACASGGLPEEAIDAFLGALELEPGLLEIEAMLHKPLLDTCDWPRIEEFVSRLRQRAATMPPETWTRGLDPWAALLLPIDAGVRREAARQHAKRIEAAASRLPRVKPALRAELSRLRIAYLSADFRNHATAHLAAGLFEHHDRRRFEVFAYSTGRNDASALRKRLEAAFEHFVDLQGAGAAAIAARIANDGIEILVDMKGYTDGNQMEALALRPAPVQVHFLGFPGSLHAGFIDYLIADRVVAPDAQGGEFGEALARLPGSYQANDDRQAAAAQTPTRAACGLPPEGFIYCCFNQSFKFEPAMVRAWMRILSATPGSVLWLLETNAAAKAVLAREATQAGVDPQRLVYAPWIEKPAHLARTRLADLFLDTHTCSAHTTASDALWSGVPVLTWPGESFAGRVAESLVCAAGLPELAVTGLPAYEETAIALSRDPDRLRELRDRLAMARASAPLFRTADFTRGLEKAYEIMWESQRAGRKPATFDVEGNGWSG